MYSEKPSRSDIEQALNCAGLSSRSSVADGNRSIVVGIQVPLSLNEGVEFPYGAGSDLWPLQSDTRHIMWEEDPDGVWRLAFVGNNFTVLIGGNVALPKGHDIHSDEHYPLIHQGNDDGRAQSIHAACVSGYAFNLPSTIRTFSYSSNEAIAELLRHGPGHKLISVNSKEIYADLFPHLNETFPWESRYRLPFPLRNVNGWVSRPILQGG